MKNNIKGSESMYCVNCGAEIENNSTFCSYCGNKIKKDEKIIKKIFVGVGIFLILAIVIFGIYGRKNIEDTKMLETNNQIVISNETTENKESVKNEAEEIKEKGLSEEMRNFLLEKSDEYGQTHSNYGRISVEPVIIEGYLEKKDKSKDPTMEDDDYEYYYITLEKATNIAYESYLDECVVEDYMDTIKLDAVNLDSLCGKKVYCCGKVIDPGVASSGIHMMTAVVIDANDGTLVSEEDGGASSKNPNFVPDCSEEEYNKIGNSFANLLNGGQVASQGGWMYYVRSAGGWGLDAWGYQEICKEPIEGGTPIVIYTALDEDIDIKYLNVVGDYIYFKEKTIKRVRCDGEEYKDYGIESKYSFSVFNNQIVYTKEIPESAEYSWWTLMVYDTVIGEGMDYDESVNPQFWGMEELQDTVIFYMGQTTVSMNEYYVSFFEVNKDLNEDFEEGCMVFNNPEIKCRLWRKKVFTGTEVLDMASNQLLCDKEIQKTDQFTFWDYNLTVNFIDDYIVGYATHPGTFKGLVYCTLEEYLNNEYHVINADKPGSILCAGQWIYHSCNNGVHRVKLDGSEYQEVKRNANG